VVFVDANGVEAELLGMDELIDKPRIRRRP
jgi:hypothetical protein